MRKQENIQIRLFWCFGIILLAALGNSAYSLLTVRHMRSELSRDVIDNAALLDDARQITISIANMRSAMRGVSLFAMMHSTEQLAKARGMFDAANQDACKDVDGMETRNLTAEDRTPVNEIRTRLAQWKQGFQQFADLSMSGHGEEASQSALKQITPLIDSLQRAAAELGSQSRDRLQKGNEAIDASMNHTERLNWTLLILVLAAAGATWYVVMRLVRSLRDIAQSINCGAQEVSGAAGHVSSASQALAQQSSEQAASLQQTSASTEEISSMARRNTENSQATAAIVGESGRRFVETNRALDEMVSGMREINASSNKISKIIKVIDEIAFQTNILALNAAVEAARAGEAGMGFAVVADEVRNLAQRSARAAQDTAELIEESIAKSSSGKLKVDHVADTIRGITRDAEKAKTLVDEVSIGSHEQLRGIEEIGKAIAQMNQLTQATAANAEESAAASEQLKAQSETLNGIAVRLSEMVGVR
jgi:methyl-accepting chemotaxis protein